MAKKFNVIIPAAYKNFEFLHLIWIPPLLN